MIKRPKGITLLIILYSILALASIFGILSTEIDGDLVDERYRDKFKIYGLFDYDKNLLITLSTVEVIVLLGLVLILLKPFPLGRFAIIGYEGFTIISTVVGFFFPKPFFPEEHPYYPIYVTGWVEYIGLVISAIIIVYLLRPKIKQYFNSEKITEM